MMLTVTSRNADSRTPSRFLAAALLVVFASCSTEKSYEVRGRVAGFGDDHRTVIVEHGEIRGLMPAMTMPFTARDSSAIASLRMGDAVSFNLFLRGDSSWIADIEKLPDDAVSEHPASRRDETVPPSSPILQAGDAVPDIQLLTHADSSLNLAALKGQPVVVTFIYTRCPLPDFCPLMTHQFVQLQERLQSQSGRPVHLLSVSLDPAYDTPDVLMEYAREAGADLSSWTFATGDSASIRDLAQQFGVFYQSEGSELVHNLSTALIGSDGRIRRIWRGSDWTADDVLQALQDTTLFRSSNT
jgi:protein SCO1/2